MRTQQVDEALSQLDSFVEQQNQLGDPGERPEELFHYTSPEGFVGIVTKKSLWASDMLSLNDIAEVQYPQDLICKVADQPASGVPSRYRERFKTQLKSYRDRIPFVACFCRHNDLLSQWRGYGGRGEGFALGFSFPWLIGVEKTPGFRLHKVIYNPYDQVELTRTFLGRASSVSAERQFSEEEETDYWKEACRPLVRYVVTFKHPSFEEEGEWRLTVPQIERCCFRPSGRRIVPYVSIRLAPEAITRVIRGPYFRDTCAPSTDTAIREREIRGAYMMLVSNNFIQGAVVQDSQIPLVE